jgi:hypothetical protein
MIKKNIILRTSNELGNQMFMYASAFAISIKLNRNLLVDNETAFLLKKNISNYGLNHFNISSSLAPDKFKFKNISGYLKRKFLIKTDFLRSKKKFYIELKDKNKITKFSFDILSKSFNKNLFIEGHYESEKYFLDIQHQIKKEFQFKNKEFLNNNKIFKEINNNNSVAICLRQNRFHEGKGKFNCANIKKSDLFTLEQINYINKAADILKNKVNNPKFFLWSNNIESLPKDKFDFTFNEINPNTINNNIDKRILSLFLMSTCKHFIVTPSTFNWWGAWLSQNNNKIIMRPSSKFFNEFKINNNDFWPPNWIKINP